MADQRQPSITRPCPSCGGTKTPRHYLCLPCWRQLPAPAQRALYRRDRYAHRRLAELFQQIENGVPLSEIRISDRPGEAPVPDPAASTGQARLTDEELDRWESNADFIHQPDATRRLVAGVRALRAELDEMRNEVRRQCVAGSPAIAETLGRAERERDALLAQVSALEIDAAENEAERDRLADVEAERDTLLLQLEGALHLRMHGQRAPGGGETWADWERQTQAVLRSVLGEEDGPAGGERP